MWGQVQYINKKNYGFELQHQDDWQCYVANGEEPLVKEEENPKEEESHPKAGEADTDFCKDMSKHDFCKSKLGNPSFVHVGPEKGGGLRLKSFCRKSR